MRIGLLPCHVVREDDSLALRYFLGLDRLKKKTGRPHEHQNSASASRRTWAQANTHGVDNTEPEMTPARPGLKLECDK